MVLFVLDGLVVGIALGGSADSSVDCGPGEIAADGEYVLLFWLYGDSAVTLGDGTAGNDLFEKVVDCGHPEVADVGDGVD